jgi:hypothetical protein
MSEINDDPDLQRRHPSWQRLNDYEKSLYLQHIEPTIHHDWPLKDDDDVRLATFLVDYHVRMGVDHFLNSDNVDDDGHFIDEGPLGTTELALERFFDVVREIELQYRGARIPVLSASVDKHHNTNTATES